MWGPARATVNITGAGEEKGEAQRGSISYVFNVCLSDIPASQSPVFPYIFMCTVCRRLTKRTIPHFFPLSLSLFFLNSIHAHKRLHKHMRARTHSQSSSLFPVGNVWHWKIILMAKVQRLNSITGTAGYWTAEYYYVMGTLGCSLLPLNTHTHTLFYWRN